MSVELRHPVAACASRRRASPIRSWFNAISHGPLGYLKSIVLGFVAGGVLFLIVAGTVSDLAGIDEVTTLCICAGGGAALFLFAAVVENYVIGRAILEEQELQRSIFGGGALLPPQPRPDVPGIVLDARVPGLNDRDTKHGAE